ncbi:hypothetical protein WA158_004852 [Blastocystis sp. Blastoise]
MSRNITLILVYLTVFIDQLGYSFVLPILPDFVSKLNGTSIEMGILVASYAFTQAISAYIMGSLSDTYGRKLFIVLSLVGSFLGPILQAYSWHIWIFILFRAATGLFAGSITLGQAVISDTCKPEERPKYMAQLGGVISFAFAFGPAIGGLLAQITAETPFLFAGGLALLVLIFVFTHLEESLPSLKEKESIKTELKKLNKKTAYDSIESERIDFLNNRLKAIDEEKEIALLKAKNKPSIKIHWNILMILSLVAKFTNESSTIIIESMYGMYIKEQLGASTLDFSLILCSTGVVSSFCQLLVFPLLHDKWHIPIATISYFGALCVCIGFILMAYMKQVWFSYISCNIMYLGYCFLTTVTPSVLSAQSPPEVQGKALSVGILVGQVAMVISPPVMGIVYETSPVMSILTGSIFGIIGFIAMIILRYIPGGKYADVPIQQENQQENENEKEISCILPDIEKKSTISEVQKEIDEQSITNNQTSIQIISSNDTSISKIIVSKTESL